MEHAAKVSSATGGSQPERLLKQTGFCNVLTMASIRVLCAILELCEGHPAILASLKGVS